MRLRPHAWTSLLLVSSVVTAASAQTTLRISVDANGFEGTKDSLRADISADGRWVTFSSKSPNLVPGDANGFEDIFLFDRQSGVNTLVSVDALGVQANARSVLSELSPDGRYVGFNSLATNFTANDTNGSYDAFVKDTQTGALTCVSVDANGVQGDNESYIQDFSYDGRFVVLSSKASNLVPGDTNGVRDIFVLDQLNATMELVSVDSFGVPGNLSSVRAAISYDGRYVAFESVADNLVASDTNLDMDVFVHDRQTGTTQRVSVGTGDVEGNSGSDGPAISPDGRIVAFASYSSNWFAADTNTLSDVFVHDLATGVLSVASAAPNGVFGDNESHLPALSYDGRFLAFNSWASNLVPGDQNGEGDNFLLDRSTGQIVRVSVSSAGAESDALSIYPAISEDGRIVAFESHGTTLVANDTNGVMDVFVHDAGPACPTPSVYCTAKVNSLGCVPTIGFSGFPSTTSPGAFPVLASNVLNNKSGLLFYSTVSAAATPFHGGLLCVQAPTHRTPVQDSGGNPPPNDCSGGYTYDFNARIQSGADPALVVGAQVWCQYYSRDPGFVPPDTAGLTQGLTLTICP